MEYIRNLQTYNTPFEKSSNDRVIEDIDNKIASYKVEDIDVNHFSYTISTTTSAIFTITGKRANYIRIESDIFENKKVSYWFLTDVLEIESMEGTRYNAKLDVIATFGLDAFSQLSNKEVHIKRFHEDRYETSLEDGKRYLNMRSEFIATKPVEFNFDSKYGNRVNYKPVDYKLWLPTVKGTIGTTTEKDSHPPHEYIVTLADLNSGSYTVTLPASTGSAGSPSKYVIKGKNDAIYVDEDYLDDGTVTVRQLPFGGVMTADATSINLSGVQEELKIYVYEFGQPIIYKGKISKGYKWYSEKDAINENWYYDYIVNDLAHKKIDNSITNKRQIFYTYAIINGVGIKPPTDYTISNVFGSNIYIAPIDVKNKSDANNIKEFEALADGKVLNIFTSPFKLQFDTVEEIHPKTDSFPLTIYGYDLFKIDGDVYCGHVNVNALKMLDNVLLDKGKIDLFDSNVIIKYTSNNDKIPASVINDMDHFDAGVITSINFNKNLSSNNQDLDISQYNFVKDYDEIDILVNEQGLSMKIFNNKYKYSIFTENNYLTFFTEQSKSYLATHKSQIAAQKKRIDLETKLNAKNTQISQTSSYGGGIIGGAMSLINPANWASNIMQSQSRDISKDIATARKNEIDASINDLKNTPAIEHLGNEHTLSNLHETGDNQAGKFFTKIEVPNKAILSRINNYFKRFGYKYDGYLSFNESIWKSREHFNYFSMNMTLNELEAKGDMDIDIIEDISSELNNGIRIFHNDKFNFSDRNIERSLVPHIQ